MTHPHCGAPEELGREETGEVECPMEPHGPGVAAITQDRLPDAQTQSCLHLPGAATREPLFHEEFHVEPSSQNFFSVINFVLLSLNALVHKNNGLVVKNEFTVKKVKDSGRGRPSRSRPEAQADPPNIERQACGAFSSRQRRHRSPSCC